MAPAGAEDTNLCNPIGEADTRLGRLAPRLPGGRHRARTQPLQLGREMRRLERQTLVGCGKLAAGASKRILLMVELRLERAQTRLERDLAVAERQLLVTAGVTFEHGNRRPQACNFGGLVLGLCFQAAQRLGVDAGSERRRRYREPRRRSAIPTRPPGPADCWLPPWRKLPERAIWLCMRLITCD